MLLQDQPFYNPFTPVPFRPLTPAPFTPLPFTPAPQRPQKFTTIQPIATIPPNQTLTPLLNLIPNQPINQVINQVLNQPEGRPLTEGRPLAEFLQESRPNDRQCYKRTCDQIISGRNLLYSRALEIVQSEQYLIEADLDLIRRFKRQTDMSQPVYSIGMFESESITEVLDNAISMLSESQRIQICQILLLNWISNYQSAIDFACENANNNLFNTTTVPNIFT